MSSYLNIYLVPKKLEGATEEPKPLLFTSYSRSSDIYQTIYEELNPAFIGNGDTPNYSELKASDVQHVINEVKNTIKKVEERLNSTIEAYKAMSDKLPEEAVEDYVSTKEYINELKETANELECIHYWASDIELGYTSFEKVLINID